MNNKSQKKYVYDYFISYADNDSEWVETYLIPSLVNRANKKVITSREANKKYGQPKVLGLQDAVIQSNQLLLVITPEYHLKIENTDFEYRKTIEVMKQYHDIITENWRIIPLIFKKSPLPFRLDFIVSIDFTDEKLWDEQLKKLVKADNLVNDDFFDRSISPYIGLESFTEKESDYFYGRSDAVEEFILRLIVNQFIVILGSSGSGKSSLVHAGLIPTIKKNEYKEKHKTIFFSMLPSSSPIEPIIKFFGDVFLSDPDKALKNVLYKGGKKKLFIFIDQFEEVFSIAQGKTEDFFDAIDFFINAPECSLVIATRSDFYANLTSTKIWCHIKPNICDLLPLSREELTEAIAKPAQEAGAGVDSLLIERMLNDAGTEEGILPFVQVTMHLLWQKLSSRYLSLSSYENLQIKDIEGKTINGLKAAIAIRANAAISSFVSDAEERVVRCILLRLVHFGENGSPNTRLPQNIDKLKVCGGDYDAVIKVLSSKEFRLLSTYSEKSVTKVKFTHESLLDGWPLLQGWIEKYSDVERQRRRLDYKRDEWLRLGKKPSGLLNKDELIEIKELKRNKYYVDLVLPHCFDHFIDASEKHITKRKKSFILIAFFMLLLSPLLFYVATISYHAFLRVKAINSLETIHFDAGNYPIGIDPVSDEESTLHNPKTYFEWKSYSIDKYEVSNKFYCLCVETEYCEVPDYPNTQGKRVCDTEIADYPVYSVSAFDAEVFCKWVNGRLPHEIEWEHAARGFSDRAYPYIGKNVTPQDIQVELKEHNVVSIYQTTKDKTPLGVYGLAGNVREWTVGKFLSYSDKQANANNRKIGELTSVRGASYGDNFPFLHISYRGFVESASKSQFIGFRCAY